jgi:hypothetical protein
MNSPGALSILKDFFTPSRQDRQEESKKTLRPLRLCERNFLSPPPRDLIIRLWGWSGYFCELAHEYQDHIMARCLYTVE